ncbi:hypothetical protein [Tenacibaculum insulae]|uniref:hypothetical protein n=1 Tax=Tenacibaculum insulae TaxID=2029677 RepID=UPI003AB1E107
MKLTVNNLVLDRGILTSAYKEDIKQNLYAIKPASLFRIKNRLKKRNTKLYSETATILKISLFAIALVALLF